MAPTLARYVDPDLHEAQSRSDLEVWARQNLPASSGSSIETVHVVRPIDTHADVAATLLYPVTERPYHELYDMVCGWSAARRNEVIQVALGSRTQRDELLRGFRGGLYAFDMVMDIGAYRDLHRHRRCNQFRQAYTSSSATMFPTRWPRPASEDFYHSLMTDTFAAMAQMNGNRCSLPAALRRPLPIPFQDGFRRG